MIQLFDNRVWGPSVAHLSYCSIHNESTPSCSCPKRYYCEGCDAQHFPGTRCPRSVLDDMVDHLIFKEKSIKRLINEILSAAEARGYNWSNDCHIEARIDELADKFGNLGITRRRLARLVRKERRRSWRRAWRRAWQKSRKFI